jgi:exo-1,4-beta-D-glucosaminidase
VASYATDSSCSFSPLVRCCGSGGHPGRSGAERFGERLAAHPASRPSPGRAAAPVHHAALSLSPADTGASDISNLGSSGWEVQSSAKATQTGAQISTPGFNTSTWLHVANDDAGAPGTEIEALAQNGQCPGDTALQPVNQSTSGPNSVFFSNNMQLCYGNMTKIGPDSVAAFDVPGGGAPTSRQTWQRARPPL